MPRHVLYLHQLHIKSTIINVPPNQMGVCASDVRMRPVQVFQRQVPIKARNTVIPFSIVWSVADEHGLTILVDMLKDGYLLIAFAPKSISGC